MESCFPVKDADEEEKLQSVEMNADILEGDDNTESKTTEKENDEKENEKQVAKEEKYKQAEEEGEGEEEAEEVTAVSVKKAPQGSDYFTKAGPKKLTNQFNFCERAALTYNNPFRVSSVEGCG